MSDSLLCVIPIVADLGGAATKCLDSIWRPDSACGLDPSEILVVDNTREGWLASDAGAETMLRREAEGRPGLGSATAPSARWPGLQVHRDPDGHQLGVARSWNIAARRVLDEGHDYLVICSSVMRFGPELHCTWRWQMERFWGSDVIEMDGHSWHAIALHRRLFEEVGLFTSGYWPAYFESIDFCRRLHIVGREHGWPHVWCNAMSQGAALHTKVVACPAEPLLALYRARWGGDKGEETFVLPYGNKPMDYDVEESIPVLAERYGLGERGVMWW